VRSLGAVSAADRRTQLDVKTAERRQTVNLDLGQGAGDEIGNFPVTPFELSRWRGGRSRVGVLDHRQL
jgi:hypothetical protein